MPKIYEHFKRWGSSNLKDLDYDSLELPSIELDALNDDILEVLKVYGNMSPYELVNRTHEQSVWKDNVKSYNRIMPFDDIRNTFLAKKVFGS